MSGFFWPASSPRNQKAEIGTANQPQNTPFVELIARITPGYEPSYEDCKLIYVYHPLAPRIIDAPIYLGFNKPRVLSIEEGPQEELIRQFEQEWETLGEQGALRWITQGIRLSAIYGISAVGVGVPGVPTDRPLTDAEWLSPDLYFQIFDSLNTAGSVTIEQDTSKPDFLKPKYFSVNGQRYHLSRGVVLQNEDPLYIQWTSSAFGFTGRSKFMRAMYPLASYVQTMIANNMIALKLAFFIAKLKSQGAIVDRQAESFFASKLLQMKRGVTGNVISIDVEEDIQTLNMINVHEAGTFARENIIKDIANGAGMPAIMLSQEKMSSGLADGTEDAADKKSYIDAYRSQQEPLFKFFDRIVMRRAWNKDFWRAMKNKYPELIGRETYLQSFQKWCDSFSAKWAPLIPSEEKDELDAQNNRFKSVTELLTVLSGMITDEGSRAELISWVMSNINAQDKIFTAPLNLDPEEAARGSAQYEEELGDPNPARNVA